MRERGGRTLPQVFASEDAAVSFIRARIAKGTEVHADESPAWNALHAKFAMKRINHQEGYSIDDACTNGAESYFSRMRRGELGHHHHIAGAYFARYAQEAAWREDHRGLSQRRSGGWRRRAGDGPWAIGRFLRILAAGESRLDHPPSRAPRRLVRSIVSVARFSEPSTVL